jgi:hypothetical protein
MKVAVAVLGALCLLLALALYWRHSRATTQSAASLAYIQSLSNQVAEIRARLAEADRTAMAQSNLHALDQRIGELASSSQQLLQATRLLSSVPGESGKTPDSEEIKAKLASIPVLQKELTESKELLSAMSAQRDWLIQELHRTRLGETDLRQKLANPAFLTNQLARVQEDARVREHIDRVRPRSALEAGADRLLLSTSAVTSATALGAGQPAKRPSPSEAPPAQSHPLPPLR